MSFAANLQRLREDATLTQAELARQAGLSIDSLRNWEQDKALPKIDAVVKLATALGVSVDALTLGAFASAPPADAPPRARGRPRKDAGEQPAVKPAGKKAKRKG